MPEIRFGVVPPQRVGEVADGRRSPDHEGGKTPAQEPTAGLIPGQTRSYPVYGMSRNPKSYEHKAEDKVRFRSALGRLNNETMEPIAKRLGRENLTVVETGAFSQVKIRNEAGEEDIVPGIWLIPSHVTDLEDYPPSNSVPAAAPG